MLRSSHSRRSSTSSRRIQLRRPRPALARALVWGVSWSLAVSSYLAAAASRPAHAQPADADQPAAKQTDLLDHGIAEWNRGNFSRARAALRKVAFDVSVTGPSSAERRIRALRYLADAVLLDETLPPHERQTLAENHLELIYQSQPDWTPPPALHGHEFYKLVNLVRTERELESAQVCEAEKMACNADLGEARADIDALQIENARLQRELSEHWVIIEERTARNRAVALVPAGIGHFYNGKRGLGITFLAAEATFGVIGLSLLLDRLYTLNCTRTNGLAPGSLDCQPDQRLENRHDPDSLDKLVEQRRATEMAFGLALLTTAVLDVVIAQITFKPYVSSGKRRVRLDELPASEPDSSRRQGKKPRSRRAKKKSRTQAALETLRPGFAVGGRQGGLSLSMKF